MQNLGEHFEVHTTSTRLPFFPDRGDSRRAMSKAELVVTEAVFFLRLLLSPRLYRGEWRLACLSGHLGALLYARVLRAVGLRRQLFLVNFYFHELGEHPLVKRVLGFLMTTDVHVVAQTNWDAEYFSAFLSPDNLKLLPYCKGHPSPASLSEVQLGDYVFSGGWTNRDYDALFRCAAQLPDIPFLVVASAHSVISESRPSNVRVACDVPIEDFNRALYKSRLVVVPLKSDVGSSGQMVLLAAMSYGKAAIVPAIGAVSGYVDDGRTGVFYRHGNDESLRDSIAELYADEGRAASVGAAARESYLGNFTPQHFDGPVSEYIAVRS